MLSGGRSQFIALKAGMPWLDINQERHYAFAGYHGMVELVREIDRTLYNPMWDQVRLPAPWAAEGDDWQSRAMAEEPEEPIGELTPEEAEAARRARGICACKGVDVGTIEDAVLSGCTSRTAVAKATNASTGCGGCGPLVDDIIEDHARLQAAA